MEEDIVKRLREQERILGEMRDNVLGWMDDLLRDAFNPEASFAMSPAWGSTFRKSRTWSDGVTGLTPTVCLVWRRQQRMKK